jgi:hypothetical protein
MQSIRSRELAVIFAVVLSYAAPSALADDSCVDFKWDVTQERALFASTPVALTAGKDLASAPVVAPNYLYKLRLGPQDGVAFAAAPGRKSAGTAVFAGLAALKIPAPGSYRISLDLPSWIDVVADGMLIAAKDFEGQHACSAPHKIVEFDLAAAQRFVLQFSNAMKDTVLVTVTASPQRKL